MKHKFLTSILIVCLAVSALSVPALAQGTANETFTTTSEIMYNTYIDQSYVAVKVQTNAIPPECLEYGVEINGTLYPQTSPLIGGQYIVDIAGLSAANFYSYRPYYKLEDTIYYGKTDSFSTIAAKEKISDTALGDYYAARGENMAVGYGSNTAFGGLDFIGRSQGQWLQSTLEGKGWAYIFGENKLEAKNILSPVLQNIHIKNPSIQAWAVPEVSDDGCFGMLTFYVRNVSENEIANYQFGVAGQVQIGGVAKTNISKMDYGVKAIKNNNAFILLCQEKDKYDTTPVNSLWFGMAKDAKGNVYNEVNKDSLSNTDLGLAFSWQNITLAAGEIKSYTIAIGIGEANALENALTAESEMECHIDYLAEEISGLNANTAYIIQTKDNEYNVFADENGALPLVDGEKGYDFIGKEITIIKDGSSTAQGQTISIADRAPGQVNLNIPSTDIPYLPEDLDVTTTDNSLTIKAEAEQEFSIDGGNSWFSDTDGNGYVCFNDLEKETAYTILARLKATESTFASVSTAFKVWLKPMLAESEITVENNFSYNGTAQSPLVSLDGAKVTYAAELKGEYQEKLEYLNAGKYTFYYKIQKDGYHDYYNQGELVINKAMPTADDFVFDAPVNLTYDGEANTVEITPKEAINGMGAIEVTYYNAQGEKSAAVNAGTYTVKISVSEGQNYTAADNLSSADWQLTIAKASVEIPILESKFFCAAWQRADIYDTSEYIVKENGGGVDAGEYPVILTLQDAQNYQWAGSTDGTETALKFTITKAVNTWLTKPALESWNYGETANTPFGEAQFGTVTYTYSTAENGEYTATIPTAAGKFWLKAVVEETSNYNGLTETLSFEIKQIVQDELTISGMPDKVYYGDSFTLTAAGGSGSGSINWSATGAANIMQDGTVTISGIGEFTISAAKERDNNYNASSATQKGTAEKRPLTITGTKAADKNYDGTKTAAIEEKGSINNAIASDKLTFSANGEFADETVGTEKAVSVTYELAGEHLDYYDFAKTAVVYAAIIPKDISQAEVVLAEELVYNGTKQIQRIKSVTVDGLDVTYDVSGNIATAAGEHELVISGTGNFAGSKQIVWNIAKALPQKNDFVFDIADNLIYDGEAKTAIVAVPDGIAGMGEIAVKYFSDGKECTPINAGEYLLKIAVSEGENYQAAESIELGSFTIAKAELTLTISANPAMIKGQAEVTVTVNGIPSEGSVILSCVNGNNETLPVEGSGNIFKITLPNAEDNYTFTAYYAATANFNQASVQCTIAAQKQFSSMVPQKSLAFVTNGGNEISAVRANYGKTIVLADYTPRRDGYEFLGWYKDEKLTEKIQYAVLDYDMTVYAKWQKIEETIEENIGEAVTYDKVIILTINDKWAIVDDEAVKSDAAALIVNSRTYTPARLVAESLGAKVVWNENSRTVTITQDDSIIVLTIDSTTAYVNGEKIQMDAAAFIADGRTFTPARFVAENLGAKVSWNEKEQRVTIIR